MNKNHIMSIIKATRSKPKGHKAYQRMTPTGKVVQVKEKPYAKENNVKTLRNEIRQLTKEHDYLGAQSEKLDKILDKYTKYLGSSNKTGRKKFYHYRNIMGKIDNKYYNIEEKLNQLKEQYRVATDPAARFEGSDSDSLEILRQKKDTAEQERDVIRLSPMFQELERLSSKRNNLREKADIASWKNRDKWLALADKADEEYYAYEKKFDMTSTGKLYKKLYWNIDQRKGILNQLNYLIESKEKTIKNKKWLKRTLQRSPFTIDEWKKIGDAASRTWHHGGDQFASDAIALVREGEYRGDDTDVYTELILDGDAIYTLGKLDPKIYKKITPKTYNKAREIVATLLFSKGRYRTALEELKNEMSDNQYEKSDERILNLIKSTRTMGRHMRIRSGKPYSAGQGITKQPRGSKEAPTMTEQDPFEDLRPTEKEVGEHYRQYGDIPLNEFEKAKNEPTLKELKKQYEDLLEQAKRQTTQDNVPYFDKELSRLSKQIKEKESSGFRKKPVRHERHLKTGKIIEAGSGEKRKSKIKQLYKIVLNRFGAMCDEQGTGDQVENFLVKRGINPYKANDLAAKFMDKMLEGKTR